MTMVNVTVQFDTEENKTTRYRVEKGKLETLQEMPGVDCYDPKVLADFLKWGMTNYPADHYLVDVWNHGGAGKICPRTSITMAFKLPNLKVLPG